MKEIGVVIVVGAGSIGRHLSHVIDHALEMDAIVWEQERKQELEPFYEAPVTMQITRPRLEDIPEIVLIEDRMVEAIEKGQNFVYRKGRNWGKRELFNRVRKRITTSGGKPRMR